MSSTTQTVASSFDATDLEVSRRAHAYEMGEDTQSDRAWYRFYAVATARIIANGWDGKFNNGKSRGLDGTEWEDGYSIDGASDAFDARVSVDQYIAQVEVARTAIAQASA